MPNVFYSCFYKIILPRKNVEQNVNIYFIPPLFPMAYEIHSLGYWPPWA